MKNKWEFSCTFVHDKKTSGIEQTQELLKNLWVYGFGRMYYNN